MLKKIRGEYTLGMPRVVKVTVTREQLRNMTERITRVRDSLAALITAAEMQKFDELDIANHDLMIRSMAGLESFDAAAWNAHHDRRKAKGDYGPANGKKPAKKKTPKKKG